MRGNGKGEMEYGIWKREEEKWKMEWKREDGQRGELVFYQSRTI